MKVYLAIVEDHHCDTTVEVFEKLEDAIEYAKTEAASSCRNPEDLKEESIRGYLYWIGYGCEGDYACVVETEIK